MNILHDVMEQPAKEPQMLTFGMIRRANIARQKEWDPECKITLEFRGLELGGEAGELQNVIKKFSREANGIKGSRATLQDAANELADVIICADLIAMDLQLDLDEAIRNKFNEVSEKNTLTTRLPTVSLEDQMEKELEWLKERKLPGLFQSLSLLARAVLQRLTHRIRPVAKT